MEDVMTLRAAIQSSDLFRGLDPYSLRSAFLKSFRRGDKVYERQDGIDCVGIVLQGSLGVEANEKSSVSVLRRGAEFGICNIFVKEKMPTKLTARVQSKVLFLPKEDFAKLLGQDNGLMYRYVRLCNKKMIYLAERLRLISISDCTERVFYYIRANAEYGTLRLRISKDELARELGISRSSLFRAISILTEQGKIVETGNVIEVLDSGEEG